jgi:hypothetical protein
MGATFHVKSTTHLADASHVHHVHYVHIFLKNWFAFVFQSIFFIFGGLSFSHTHFCDAHVLLHVTCAIHRFLVKRPTPRTPRTHFFEKIGSPLFFSRFSLFLGGYLSHIPIFTHYTSLYTLQHRTLQSHNRLF